VGRGLAGQFQPLVTRDQLAGNLKNLARKLGSTRDIAAWLRDE
jgi:hypothetical protein